MLDRSKVVDNEQAGNICGDTERGMIQPKSVDQ